MIQETRKLFKFLWPFCKENRKFFYVLAVIVLISVLLELPFPLFLKYFIDTIIKNKNLSALKIFTLVLASLFIFKFIIDNLKHYFLFSFKEKTFINLQNYIFKEVFRVKYKFFEENNTGYIVSRVHNEVLNLQGFYWDFFIKLLTDVLLLTVGLYFIFKFSVKLSIISLSFLPFFMFTFSFFSKKIKEQANYFQEAYSNVYGFFYEMVQMIFLVKTLLLQDYGISKLRNILGDLYKVKLKNNIINVLFTTIVALIGGLSPIVVLYVGGLEVINGKLSLGTLIAFNSFLGYIFGPTKNILGYGSNLASSLASFGRITSILHMEKDCEDGEKLDNISKIEFKNVSFAYNSKNVLSDVNFRINKGQKIGVLGKIGSGKSTLIKLLLGLYSDYSGEILINDKNIRNIKRMTERVGIVPQDNILFSDSIYNNIRVGDLQKDTKEISDVVKVAQLEDLIGKKENGINYKLNAGGVGLSGGEKQKLVAARLFYRNPDLIIVDEGTSNLDAESEYFIQKMLFELFKDKIVIIISHRFSNITKCDNIVYIQEGRIADIDTHKNLLKNHKEYKDLYLKQQSK